MGIDINSDVYLHYRFNEDGESILWGVFASFEDAEKEAAGLGYIEAWVVHGTYPPD